MMTQTTTEVLIEALRNILADCETAQERRTTADWDFATCHAIEYARVTNVKIFADDVPLFAAGQRSTLIAQREQLLRAAQFALSMPGMIQGRDSLQQIVDEVLTTVEQEGTQRENQS